MCKYLMDAKFYVNLKLKLIFSSCCILSINEYKRLISVPKKATTLKNYQQLNFFLSLRSQFVIKNISFLALCVCVFLMPICSYLLKQ